MLLRPWRKPRSADAWRLRKILRLKKLTVGAGSSPHDMAIGKQKELLAISSPSIIKTELDVAHGVDFLKGVEPRFAAVASLHGVPSVRLVDNNLASLLQIITEQLISLQASEAIWQRVRSSLYPISSAKVLAVDHDGLRKLGLTGAKARSFRAIASAVEEGYLSFDRLADMADQEAFKNLVSLQGVGPWTADIYLLSALGRADAFPSGDLALQVAAQNLFKLPERPAPKVFLAMAESWRPWRSVAARLLWSHYRGLKGISQA